MFRIILSVLLVCLSICTTSLAFADGRTTPEGSQPELIGRIYLDSVNDLHKSHIRRKIDSFATKIRVKHNNEIIRIEGAYHLSASRSINIDKSLLIARNVERYLRLHHRLQLNLCIASDNGYPAQNDKISVAIFAVPGEYIEKNI